MCDPTGSGNVGRDGLYKSLALAALAQQGKGIDEKALHHYGESGESHVMKPVQTRGGVCNNIVVELEALRLLWCLSPYGGYFLLASWPPSQKTNICGNNFFDYFPRQSFLLPHWPPLRKCVIPA